MLAVARKDTVPFMRLICGLMHLDGTAADTRARDAMLTALDLPRLSPHRATWQQGPVALGMLDFSGRPEPVLQQKDGTVLAADIRLDEPQGLNQDEQLARLLAESGPAGLAQLSGDFAFAQWNGERLLCGRDHFGIRPFSYVYLPGRHFVFASLSRALHESGAVAAKVDTAALVRRLQLAWTAQDSLVAGVRRLPPAHVLEISPAGLSLTRYWQVDRKSVGTRRISAADAASELRRLVERAVRTRIARNGQIGAHLSGGLDSSAITVLAARELREQGRRLHAYSFLDRQRNDAVLEDESAFVDAIVAQEGDLDWSRFRPQQSGTADRPVIALDTFAAQSQDEPDNQACAQAEAQGVGILLSGWGGDEAASFSGRGALAELLRRGRLATVWRELAALRRRRGLSWRGLLKGEILAPFLPQGAARLARRMLRREPDLEQLLHRLLTAKLDAPHHARIDLTLPDAGEIRSRLIESPHIAERAEADADRGARHGIAFAYPLLDRHLVTFMLTLPAELFIQDGWRRRLFRDAMVGVLPDRVRLRHEKYLSFPSRLLDLADNRDNLLTRIDALGANPAVTAIVDLAALRREVENFPSAEDLRPMLEQTSNASAPARVAAADVILMLAEYLDQHSAR